MLQVFALKTTLEKTFLVSHIIVKNMLTVVQQTNPHQIKGFSGVDLIFKKNIL